MKNLYLSILFFGASAAYGGALIDQGGGLVCPTEYRVVCINGVLTTPEDIILAEIRLREIYKFRLNSFAQVIPPVPVETFYNPTGGFLEDVAEAYKGAIRTNPQLAGKWELLVTALHGTTEFSKVIGINAGSVDLVSRLIVDPLARAVAKANPSPLEATFAARINAYMDKKVAVTVVAHSQGNFFADAIYTILKPRLDRQSSTDLDGKTVVFRHIAPPNAVTTTKAKYYLNRNDKVINAVRKLTGTVAEPNLTYDFESLDPQHATLTTFPVVYPNVAGVGGIQPDPVVSFQFPSDYQIGHGFLGTYLNIGYKASDKIDLPMPGAYTAPVIYLGSGPRDCNARYP